MILVRTGVEALDMLMRGCMRLLVLALNWTLFDAEFLFISISNVLKIIILINFIFLHFAKHIINKQNQMKKPATLIRPAKERSKSAITSNMFADLENNAQLVQLSTENHETYDFVGPLEFRKKLQAKYPQHLKPQPITIIKEQAPNQFNSTTKSKNMFSNTIGKDTMLESLNKEQQIQVTKHSRNLQRFKDYKNVWDKNTQYIQNELHKKGPILMDSNIKKLHAQPNQDKTDVINNFIVHYWEMSLRNNHHILERHIKGNTFDKLQKEKLMQYRSGMKKIEDSIPILPLDRLNHTKNKDLCLSGRNKIKKEAQSSEGFNTTRYSLGGSGRVAQQEVFKINYEGDKKWMGSQNL